MVAAGKPFFSAFLVPATFRHVDFGPKQSATPELFAMRVIEPYLTFV